MRMNRRIAVTTVNLLMVLACSARNMTPGAAGSNAGGGLGGINSGGANTSSGGSAQAQGGFSTVQGGRTGQGGASPSQGGSVANSGGSSASSGGSSTSSGGSGVAQGGIAATGGKSGVSSGGQLLTGGTSSSNTSSGGITTSSGGTSSITTSSGGSASIAGGAPSTNTGGQISMGTGGTTVVRKPAARPAGDPASCGSWALTEGVCCAQYCTNDDKSESCTACGGPGSAQCEVVNSKGCESGQWPETRSVGDSEPWHYSRSTHFGLTASGACAFGLYGLCTTAYKFNSGYAQQCDAFCKAYPDLCRDPADTTLHGNFAAPQGNYYSQFWPDLPGDNDNYLSCGECFELVRTQKDGTEYKPGDAGYTPPIVIQVVDSCPCAANSKWCCGSGRDHCGEVSDFKYGCQLPPSPPPPAKNHDPTSDESIHFDLSDIAMARLQSGTPDGAMPDGVIPTKYKRIPCPVLGNMYFWLQTNANEYYFALSVVNMAKMGAPATVEARLPSGTWVGLQRNSNYTMSRPQERYGTWVLPQNSGKFDLPVSIRVTDGSGRSVVAEGAIKSWTPADSAQKETYYIDSGVQF